MRERSHPYRQQPDQAFWRRAVADVAPDALTPVADFPVKITPDTRIATAGSCFAQNIARNLAKRGFNYYIAEPAHPIATMIDGLAESFGYTMFSARYGNIYTARQLRQLIARAYGRFDPAEPGWQNAGGGWCDPFRPSVEPGGFASIGEMLADREKHLSAVREMFETLDIFVFTLGLTEGWEAIDDGAAFPICPGVQAGAFDPARYRFFNQTVAEVVADMTDFFAHLNEVNPTAQVILTVSPVPLVATAEDRHVLVSTVASKAILRAAADELERAHDTAHYFPSFEIVTSSANASRYFAPDLRAVTDEAVDHVMRVFFQAVTTQATSPQAPEPQHIPVSNSRQAEAIFQTVCDEESLDPAP